jgi:membrane protein implicated in regulation of membrane protease activity
MSENASTATDSPPTPRSFLRDNSLSLVFGALLLLCLAGQGWWGVARYNEEARTAGLQEISLWRYVTSSSFAVDVAENWQSEFLQFSLYIALTVWLVQRGSSESKKPGDEGRESDEKQLVGRYARPDSPSWARVGGWRTRLYSHSLVTVMSLVFLCSWSAQAVAGRVASNEERLRDHLDPQGLGEYLASPDFWGRTLQNWQSELLAIGTMAVFAIYLRERGSPESKEVGAPHAMTRSSD